MKKLALLCGLLTALYIPLQAQAADGWYSRAVCSGSQGYSILGFAYSGIDENTAKQMARTDCMKKIPKWQYSIDMSGDPIGGLTYLTAQGASGSVACGEERFNLGIGASQDEAIKKLESTLNSDRRGGNAEGPVFCYDNTTNVTKEVGSASWTGAIRLNVRLNGERIE